MCESNHDDMLFEMLRDCKTLPKFLDDIFGFLQRRTDFYHVSKEENATVGLPEGLAEKLVRHTFLKWKPVSPDIIYTPNEIPVSTEETVVSFTEDLDQVSSTTKDELEDGVEEFSFSKSEYYNGAVFEHYCWSQSITEIDVIVRIPKDVSTKDLEVKLQSSSISVKLRDGDYILSGDLCEKCKATETVWSLDGRKLLLHLDKCQEKWWNCLIKSEPQLDISKIDCTRAYDELPEHAQVKIEELQWNHERKRLGLPTSEELEVHETLKKAWNAEGSPFSGPFDPTAVKYN
ncbi:nudC domain-containing protein 3 [Diabrotica undecimpunctata]|uniref:nudC domain-containing protein 3 n=1 Tax=Diabrotica undecimpunctata TaxID=50387 RepID=UPI003B6349F2